MVLNPPGTISDENSLKEGDLVMYEQDGKPIIAGILAWKGQKCLLLNDKDKELELEPKRLHRLPSKIPAHCSTTRSKGDHIAVVRAEVNDAANSVDLEKLHSLLADDNKPYQVAELTDKLFGKNNITNHAALRIALVQDKVYFKRDKDAFVPRSKEHVEQQKNNERVKKEREKLREKTFRVLATRLKGGIAEFSPELQDTLRCLEEVAAGKSNIDPANFREARELLNEISESLNIDLHGSPQERAYSLLIKVKHINSHTNLSFVRHGPIHPFSAEALKLSDQLASDNSSTPPPSAERLDLTDLEIFTVDDNSTKDMDDGLSVERRVDGWRIGVHISDVAYAIQPGTALDIDIRKRATSIYAPEKTVNMLPDALAENRCSLVANEVRPALTAFFEIDRNFNIISRSMHLSSIRVTQRYSYEDADKLIDSGDDRFATLFQIGASLEAERFMAGGSKIQKKEIIVSPIGNDDFYINEIDEAAPGRNLIGEMMVLANSFFAEFAVQNNIPVFFRSQPPSADDLNTVGPTDGPAYAYRQRSKLKRSHVSLEPSQHATLGLRYYTQSTSPIRRYMDLVNQRQFSNFLTHGVPFYTSEELLRIQDEVDGPLNSSMAITKESKRFWILHLLKHRAKTQPTIKGTVLRVDLKNPLVELAEVYIPALARTKKKHNPGDELLLRIAAVNPHDDYLKLEEV